MRQDRIHTSDVLCVLGAIAALLPEVGVEETLVPLYQQRHVLLSLLSFVVFLSVSHGLWKRCVHWMASMLLNIHRQPALTL